MPAEIIFIVDHFDKSGMFQTVEDKLRIISQNWHDNLYRENKEIWNEIVGGRIRFQAYNTIENFDPNKRYFYFCPIRNYENDIQKYFSLLNADMLKRFNENNVHLLFAQDLEMIPNFEWDFMVKSLEWLWTVRAYNGYPNIKILFAFASKLIPEQENFLRHHFNNSIQFIYSPIILDWHRKKLVDHLLDQEVILRDYLSTNKHRQFVCLNKEPRMSRMLFLHGLRTENLLDQGFISIRKSIAYSPDLVTNRSPYASKVRADMNYMLPEMRADNVDIAPGDNIEIAHTLPLDLMKYSSYEMISETTTRYELKNVTDFCTLSEKTTKILYSGRPFMINGGPHLLRLIRDLGFRTHDYLFDESYDDKLDILDRHEIIMNNIKRYHNRPNDVLEIAKQHVDVLIHNQERLRTFDQADYWVKTLVNT